MLPTYAKLELELINMFTCCISTINSIGIDYFSLIYVKYPDLFRLIFIKMPI
jgi:hypothetical protein